MPTTSRVETDFSFMNYCRDEYNPNLSDYSLEGVMFARQLKALDSLTGASRTSCNTLFVGFMTCDIIDILRA